MATGNVGNLNVKLTLTAAQFGAALSAAGGDVNKFAMQVQTAQAQTKNLSNVASSSAVATNQFGGSMKGLSAIMSSASFGAADFASQLGTRGLGGALQAAANNIQVMGAAWGPQGLAISSTIGLILQAGGAYLEYTDKAAKATEKSADRMKSAFERVGAAQKALTAESERMNSNATLRSDVFSKFGGASSSTLQGMISSGQLRGETLTNEFQSINQQRIAVFERMGQLVPNAANRRKMNEAMDAGRPIDPSYAKKLGDAGVAELKRLRQEELKIEQEREANQKRLEAMISAAGDARKREVAEAIKSDRSSLLSQYETPMDRLNRERKRLADAVKSGAISQEEADRFSATLNPAKPLSSGPAPGVGAFDSRTAQGYSQLQESLRSAMSMTQKPQEKSGQETAANTKQTATNTANIERRLRDIRIANIA